LSVQHLSCTEVVARADARERALPAKRGQPTRLEGLLNESQGQNLTLTVFSVPSSLDSGERERERERGWVGRDFSCTEVVARANARERALSAKRKQATRF